MALLSLQGASLSLGCLAAQPCPGTAGSSLQRDHPSIQRSPRVMVAGEGKKPTQAVSLAQHLPGEAV